MARSWLRYKFLDPRKINGSKLSRYYVDAIRSDGKLVRAGIDADPETKSLSEIHAALMENLNYFLESSSTYAHSSVDAHKGEEGWIDA